MKKISLFTKFRNADPLKGARLTRLRLENLEERQLLSVTDLAALDAPSDDAEPVQLTTAANLSDAPIDVSSVHKTTGTAALDALNAAQVIYNAYGATTDEEVVKLTITEAPGGNLTLGAFPNLTELVASRCALTSLDVSALPNLSVLDCSNNNLTALNLSANTLLETLYCYNNSLTTLNLSPNASLTHLHCYDNNLMTLDLSGAAGLTYLYCYNNGLTSLDLTANVNLKDLRCYNNSLTSLELTANASLKELRCYENSLTTLELSGGASLTYLSCYANNLTTLNLSANTNLTSLSCYDNNLTTLNLSNFTKLRNLYCYNNNLTTLELSGAANLKYLYCYNNDLTTLELSNVPSLETVYCYNNNLTTLGLSGAPSLSILHCYDNNLTTLDLSANTNLYHFYCYNNNLMTLDLSANTKLYHLYCYNNNLTELDLSANTKLYHLYCYNNNLTELDLSANTKLYHLYCYNNNLTELELAANTNLSYLTIDYDVETLIVKRGITVNLENLPDEATVQILDSSNNEISFNHYYDRFYLPSAAAGVVDPVRLTTNTNGVETQMLINPMVALTDYAGSAYAVVDVNKEMTDVNLYEGITAADLAVALGNYTVEESAAFVSVADGKLISSGGLNSSGTPYVVTITAVEPVSGVVQSVEYDLTINQAQLAAPTGLLHAATSDSLAFTWDAVPNATGYAVVFNGATYTTDTNSYTAVGLASNTEYAFSVSATAPDMIASDVVELTARTFSEATATQTSLSTDSPIFGCSVAVNIAPDSTATYAWSCVDAENIETPLGAEAAEYCIGDAYLLGKRLKAVVTYTSGEFAGQTVALSTANAVAQEVPGGYGDAASDAELTSQFFVTTTADVVNPNDGHISLREALANAPDGAVIAFADQIIGRTIILTDTLQIERPVTIDAWNLFGREGDAPPTFEGMTIDGAALGYTSAVDAPMIKVHSSAGAVVLRGLTLTNSASVELMQNAINSSRDGVAIYAENNDSLRIENCAITNIKYGATGALDVGSALFKITNSLVADNAAVNAVPGAGLYFSGAEGALYNCTVANNTTVNGADSYGLYSASSDEFNVYNSIFTGHAGSDFYTANARVWVTQSVVEDTPGGNVDVDPTNIV
ncbi:MAG: leucine-rich repeat domain-containing protein [Thermoguttaceae bacterium]|jgi:Leucine-rich repeat (LRR) protein|nr:leucine-rich repeat domain-containing protein [Thermoguttaceae bacterium]